MSLVTAAAGATCPNLLSLPSSMFSGHSSQTHSVSSSASGSRWLLKRDCFASHQCHWTDAWVLQTASAFLDSWWFSRIKPCCASWYFRFLLWAFHPHSQARLPLSTAGLALTEALWFCSAKPGHRLSGKVIFEFKAAAWVVLESAFATDTVPAINRPGSAQFTAVGTRPTLSPKVAAHRVSGCWSLASIEGFNYWWKLEMLNLAM